MTTTVVAAATSRLAVTTRTGVDNASGAASSSGAARGATAARTAAAAMTGRGARDSTGPRPQPRRGTGDPRRRAPPWLSDRHFAGAEGESTTSCSPCSTASAPHQPSLRTCMASRSRRFSWEVDRLCVKLASARMPWMKNRGDPHCRLGPGGGCRHRESRPPGPGDRHRRGGTSVPRLLSNRVGSRPHWRQRRPLPQVRRLRARHSGAPRRPPPGFPLRERRHGAQGRGGGIRGPGGGTVRRLCVGLRLDIEPAALVDVAGGDDHVDR